MSPAKAKSLTYGRSADFVIKGGAIMKGALKNEEAIGLLAVAKQLHQHYSGSQEAVVGGSKGRDMQGYLRMWDTI